MRLWLFDAIFLVAACARIYSATAIFYALNTMKWLVCIKNAGFEVPIEVRKLYSVEDDQKAQALGMLRAVDESGEGYLHAQEMFASIAIQNAL